MKVRCIDREKGSKPVIPLTVCRVEYTVFASLGFAKEHYLTAELNPSCRCLLFEWDGVPVAFVAVLNTPRKGMSHGMSISRTVILPAYQGLGLSRVIGDFVGAIVCAEGDDYRLFIKGAHELQWSMLNRNANWKGTTWDNKAGLRKDPNYKNRLYRKSYCKEYIGERKEGYHELLMPIKELRAKKEREFSLFEW